MMMLLGRSVKYVVEVFILMVLTFAFFGLIEKFADLVEIVVLALI